MRLPHALLAAPLLLAPAAPVAAAAQTAPVRPQDRFDGVRELLAEKVDSGAVAGAVALVHAGGETVFFESVGRAALGSEEAMAKDAIFRIYSMTKPITAVAALMLVEEGALELDAPLSEYVPAFAELAVGVVDDGELRRAPAERPVRVADLLTHTSGFTYGVFDDHPVDRLYLESGVFDEEAPLEEMARRLAALPLKNQPGERCTYGVSSDVLGLVVQVVAEQPFEAFLAERIFVPLGMVDTAFHVPESKQGRLVGLHEELEGELRPSPRRVAGDDGRPPKAPSGGGGLFSTASDYLRFVVALTDGSGRLLKPETVAEMTRDHLGDRPRPGWMFGAGFGYGVGVQGKRRALFRPGSAARWYWGGAAGTSFWVDPEDGSIGIFLVQNWLDHGPSIAFEGAVGEALAGD